MKWALVSLLLLCAAWQAVAPCPPPPSCGVLGCPCSCGVVYESGGVWWCNNGCLPDLCATMMLGCPSGMVYLDVQTETTCKLPGECTYLGTCVVGYSTCQHGNCYTRTSCPSASGAALADAPRWTGEPVDGHPELVRVPAHQQLMHAIANATAPRNPQ